ncbi:MAG: hydantoinase B/oxoprolinase family protein [Alphaproteobacteria bacterium]|nr:hydantoinase B/oxoprolinase family protein [Alphaproteobacteria bacterium]
MILDPITTEVVLSRVRETASAMAHALFHSGYSPILRESQDGTAGLTDATGRVIIVGGGLQYHSLLYSKSVEAILARYPADTMQEGDSFISNDPYKAGNSHVPDMVVATPAFHRGRIIAFGVSVAHKADVGGLVPGSSGAASREIFHDGVLIPPVRYWSAAGVNREVEAILRNNSRIPEVVIGDLRGQVGATRLGGERMRALADQYGVELLLAAMDHLLATTGARVRAEFATWADGVSEAEGFLDHDGADTTRRVRIHVRATKAGDRLTLDFSGSDPQTRGPVNTPMQTAKAVSLLAVLAASDPSIRMNSGVLDAVAFVMPEGRVVSPQYPATVNHYFPTSHLVYNVVLAALGKLNPARAVAPSGLGTGAIAVGYSKGRAGKASVQYEITVTALGGTATHDGTAMVLPMNHFTPGTPVEILETEYPVRVRRFDTWTDSGGAGLNRGGIGAVREYELLEDCILTARTANHKEGTWGLAGGASPPLSRTTIAAPGGASEDLDVLETRQARKGTVLTLWQTGGGGYGDPRQRAPEAVLRDVADGYVSRAAAEALYGVVVTADGALDAAATAARRAR